MGYPVYVPTIHLYGDDDLTQEYDITQGGVAYDLSDWTDWAAQWRILPASPIALTLGADVDAAAGTISVTFAGSTVRTMLRNGFWDIQAVRISDGTLRTWLRGRTSWELDVTRV